MKTQWLDSIRSCADSNISLIWRIFDIVVLVIAGNKSDMKENRVVPQEVGVWYEMHDRKSRLFVKRRIFSMWKQVPLLEKVSLTCFV